MDTKNVKAVGLSPAQKKAAALLAQGLKKNEVARQVGVTSDTIRDWEQHPRVGPLFRDLRDSLEDEQMLALHARAIDRMESLLDDDNPFVGLQAAQSIFKWRQELRRRIDGREASSASQQPAGVLIIPAKDSNWRELAAE